MIVLSLLTSILLLNIDKGFSQNESDIPDHVTRHDGDEHRDYYDGNDGYDDDHVHGDNDYNPEPGPEAADFTNCGGEITELPEAQIKTPHYPSENNKGSRYPNGAYCKWWFDGDEKTLVRFKMWDLSIQIGHDNSNVTCDYDYLEVTVDSIGSTKYCGYETPKEEIRGKGSFKLVFVSDGKENFRGMRASYQIREDFDPCDPTPCSQFGTCEVQSDLMSIKCLCEPGFTGEKCEIDINECESNPCLHGGTCDDRMKPDHYICDCVIGYEGDHCETKIIHPCIPDPCQNGGICHNHTEKTYSCECPTNFTGSNCEEDNYPPCISNPCQNSAECSDVTGEQKYIEVPPPLGTSLPPKNVSRPIEYLGFNCTCTEKYWGELCETMKGCGDPGIPDLEEDYWFDADSVVEYSCADGYFLEGDETTTCYENGTWSSPMPKCIVNETAAAMRENGPKIAWASVMIALGIAFTLNLAAFAAWMAYKKPWGSPDTVTNLNQGQDNTRSVDCESSYLDSEDASSYTSRGSDDSTSSISELT